MWIKANCVAKLIQVIGRGERDARNFNRDTDRTRPEYLLAGWVLRKNNCLVRVGWIFFLKKNIFRVSGRVGFEKTSTRSPIVIGTT